MWSPLPGPQTEALASEADEIFYGGAAGGGKTDLVLGLSLTQHTDSIIFRREYPQLKGIVKRSREIIGLNGRYNGQDHVWTLPHGTIELGAVQHLKDVLNFQGRPHDLVAFDEITHFLESQFRFLKGWARTTDPNQRVRIVATGNPPTTPEGEWVIRYWAPWLDDDHTNPAKPGELRWFAVLDGEDAEVEDGEPFEYKGETIEPLSRTFIPAMLEDNPFLMATNYGSQLQSLPEPMRSQMRYGAFNLALEDDPWQCIPSDWIRAAQARWENTPRPSAPLSSVGVDVARGGSDDTVVSKVYGTWFDELVTVKGKDTPDGPSAAMVVSNAMGDEEAPIFVDVIGVGSSCFDSLVGMNMPAHAFSAGSSAPDNATDRSKRLGFKNLRAFVWWRLREALDPNTGLNLSLPPDRGVMADLSTPKYKVVGKLIQIEAKIDIIKRLGWSPDRGDSITYAWYGASNVTKMEYHSVAPRRYNRARGWA